MITTSYMSLSLGLVGCRDESDDIFKREPADKDCFGDLKEVLLPWKKEDVFLFEGRPHKKLYYGH